MSAETGELDIEHVDERQAQVDPGHRQAQVDVARLGQRVRPESVEVRGLVQVRQVGLEGRAVKVIQGHGKTFRELTS